MEILDSYEFSADECSITCLPAERGQTADEENFIDINLDELVQVDVCGEVVPIWKWFEKIDISRKKLTS